MHPIVYNSEQRLKEARQALIKHQEHVHTTCTVCRRLMKAITKASSQLCADRLTFEK